MAQDPFAVRYLLTGACINLDQLRWQYRFNPKALAIPTTFAGCWKEENPVQGPVTFFHEKNGQTRPQRANRWIHPIEMT
jgi:hypothetical protein